LLPVLVAKKASRLGGSKLVTASPEGKVVVAEQLFTDHFNCEK